MDGLTDAERAFLAGLRGGDTIDAAAARLGYSSHWGKWKSRELRGRLGARTIREAVAMADDDDTVSRSDFEQLTKLVGRLGDALEDLAKRPGDEGKQERVRERELDVKDHAKALGLSLDDVEKLKGEKEYERFRAMQERLDAERAAADEGEGEGEGEGDGENGGGIGTRILDGLGGARHVKAKP